MSRKKKTRDRDDGGAAWSHPGGKLAALGAGGLTDEELLAILISTGYAGVPAERIAREILAAAGSLEAICREPLDALLRIKGLGTVKSIRIAAALEIAVRIAERRRRVKSGIG